MTQRTMYDVKCTSCGQPATVPFKPTPNKPVYCRTCFAKTSTTQTTNQNKNQEFDLKDAWARLRK